MSNKFSNSYTSLSHFVCGFLMIVHMLRASVRPCALSEREKDIGHIDEAISATQSQQQLKNKVQGPV